MVMPLSIILNVYVLLQIWQVYRQKLNLVVIQ